MADVCIRHDRQELAALGDILSQKGFRETALLNWLAARGYSLAGMRAIAARGGLIRPLSGGVYRIDAEAAADARSGRYGMHPANLGMLIAREWAEEFGIPAFFVDAPVTDEFCPQARYSGFRELPRRSVFHALNTKRAVRLYCQERGLDPVRSRFVVAHMGGGITVSAVSALRAVDATNGVDGEGPFTPERSGGLPVLAALRLAGEREGGLPRFAEDLYRAGGLQSYLGSNDVARLFERAGQEPEVRQALEAMLYGIAKWIGAMACVLEGRVDRILLTGGIACCAGLMEDLIRRVEWIAGCTVYPGEDELAALAEGVLRVLTGEEEVRRLDG